MNLVTKVSPPGYKLSMGCTTIVETVNNAIAFGMACPLGLGGIRVLAVFVLVV